MIISGRRVRRGLADSRGGSHVELLVVDSPQAQVELVVRLSSKRNELNNMQANVDARTQAQADALMLPLL